MASAQASTCAPLRYRCGHSFSPVNSSWSLLRRSSFFLRSAFLISFFQRMNSSRNSSMRLYFSATARSLRRDRVCDAVLLDRLENPGGVAHEQITLKLRLLDIQPSHDFRLGSTGVAKGNGTTGSLGLTELFAVEIRRCSCQLQFQFADLVDDDVGGMSVSLVQSPQAGSLQASPTPIYGDDRRLRGNHSRPF